MKILYAATDQTLSEYHGGTIHILAVARELKNLGHEVHLLVQESTARVPVEAGIQIHTLPPRSRYFLWRHGKAISRILAEIDPDLVMERYYNFSGEAIIHASRSGIRTILEVNSPMVEYKGSPKSILDFFFLGTMKRRRMKIGDHANLIITPMKNIVPEKFLEKVEEMEWGVDTTLFDPSLFPDKELVRMEKGFSDDEILFLHFGSLRPWHGLDKLLRVFDRINKELHRPARLIVVGPVQRSAQESVHFAGMVPHEEMPEWLKMCDVAVFPFSPEQHHYLSLGFYWSPLKIFEAMAMELPLITLDNSRLRGILGTEDSGFFYDGTEADLGSKMKRMIEYLPVYQATARQFRERVLISYSWQNHARKLNQWIQQLASV